ncbi:MAG: hypothetical protein PWP02_76 [Thermosipho sp. (in: thermotogales)]|nr:hypothetical protein [Thermosipho sp. (in: thermotogales)]
MKINKLIALVFVIVLTSLGISQVYFTEFVDLTNVVIEFLRKSETFLYISSYSLDNEEIITEILRLYESGIDVKILLENPSPKLGDLIKIDREKSLHHAKFIVNDSGVLFGSANFTESGLKTGFNDVIIFSDYIDQFKNLFLNLWEEGKVVDCKPFLVVGYDDVEEKILEHLYNAKNRIYLSVFAFTNEKIFALLKYKESKGLDIKIITDSWFYSSKLNKYPIRNIKIIDKPMLHHKFMIIDNKVILGSANFTLNGLNKNFEMVYITQDYLEDYLEVFDFLWGYNCEDDCLKN